MLISGNFLPVPSSQSGNPIAQDTQSDRGRSTLDLSRDTERQTRQQTVEYVFRGEFFDEVENDQRNRPNVNQQIDPANREAISSYAENSLTPTTNTERQGQYLDLFI